LYIQNYQFIHPVQLEKAKASIFRHNLYLISQILYPFSQNYVTTQTEHNQNQQRIKIRKRKSWKNRNRTLITIVDAMAPETDQNKRPVSRKSEPKQKP
jgi:hypothetical protein